MYFALPPFFIPGSHQRISVTFLMTCFVPASSTYAFAGAYDLYAFHHAICISFCHLKCLRCNRRTCRNLTANHLPYSSTPPLQSHLPYIFCRFLSALGNSLLTSNACTLFFSAFILKNPNTAIFKSQDAIGHRSLTDAVISYNIGNN